MEGVWGGGGALLFVEVGDVTLLSLLHDDLGARGGRTGEGGMELVEGGGVGRVNALFVFLKRVAYSLFQKSLRTGILSGYLVRMRCASAWRLSAGCNEVGERY